MINLHERMLPTSAGVEPATSWSPVGRCIQLSHRGRVIIGKNKLFKYGKELSVHKLKEILTEKKKQTSSANFEIS